jgi:hypothetical protein
MRGLIYGLVVANAFAAPTFAGDLTSIEVDPSGKAIAVKKDPGKLAPIPDIGGYRTKVSTMRHSIRYRLTALISAKASM